ncbi:MAG: hypothetical protein K0R73_1261 [Candidatus Midichloriaceae bacterium]|jgi:hypothetical protein|nr:hypothetical protein [Candidatus Midichloriaceae bacterium]
MFAKGGDILGSAEIKLFRDCIGNLTAEQRQDLKYMLTENNLFSEEMLEMLEADYKPRETYKLREFEVEYEQVERMGNVGELKERLKNGNQVLIVVFRALKENISATNIANLMEDIITDAPQWWDCNGGIHAISLLGNAFNEKFADYYIKRLDTWRNNLPIVQDAIIRLLSNKDLDQDNYLRCLKVAKKIFEMDTRNHYSQDIVDILQASSPKALKVLAGSINNCFSLTALEKDLFDMVKNKQLSHPRVFDVATERLFLVFHLAHAFECAVIFNMEKDKVIIYCNEDVEIKVDKSVRDIFSKFIESAVNKLKQWKEKGNRGSLCAVSFSCKFYEKIKAYETAIARLSYKGDHIDDIYDLITYYKWDQKFDYWAINCGIDIVGYLGQYFNQDLANRLVQRAKMWPDNCSAAIHSLHRIYEILSQVSYQDNESYKSAIIAYNNCIEEIKESKYFVEDTEKLQAISI